MISSFFNICVNQLFSYFVHILYWNVGLNAELVRRLNKWYDFSFMIVVLPVCSFIITIICLATTCFLWTPVNFFLLAFFSLSVRQSTITDCCTLVCWFHYRIAHMWVICSYYWLNTEHRTLNCLGVIHRLNICWSFLVEKLNVDDILILSDNNYYFFKRNRILSIWSVIVLVILCLNIFICLPIIWPVCISHGGVEFIEWKFEIDEIHK